MRNWYSPIDAFKAALDAGTIIRNNNQMAVINLAALPSDGTATDDDPTPLPNPQLITLRANRPFGISFAPPFSFSGEAENAKRRILA